MGTKDAEVTDAPSRFLALLYFFRPSLIVALNSLVYGLEGEQPPDSVAKERSEGEKKAKKNMTARRGGFSPLRALGSVLGFFAWLEMFCTRIGVAWILRDPIIILILVLVLVLQPIIAGALAACRVGRQSLQWCMQAHRKRSSLGQCTDALASAPSGELFCQSLSQDVCARSVLSTRAVRRAKTSLDAAACTRIARRAKTSLYAAAGCKPISQTQFKLSPHL